MKFTPNRISAAFLLAIAVAVWWHAGTFPQLDGGHPGPSLFPRLIALLIAVASIGLFFLPLKKEEETVFVYEFSGDHFRLLGILASTALIPLIYQAAGLLPGIGGLVLLTAFLFKVRWWVALITAGGTALGVYVIFGFLLGVPL
ncbi:MAG: tripartite tricarboxylate transporter TctB family protein [Bacteroidia bacterium]